MPISVVTTGNSKAAANSRSAAEASPLMTPPPASISAVQVERAPVARLRRGQQFEETRSIFGGERAHRASVHAPAIARDCQRSVAVELAFPVLHILRYVDHDRAGPSRAGDLECRAHGGLELHGVGHEEYVFRDRPHDRGDRCLLECV